ncbi:MAG TPA: molybdopterin cofactor-binding domain-containing protein [Thermoanaerobaculia bacterium]|nr:molybdopterin cofactor-binding domain-containing protein [Thermoanaerobaculia bacterium]
MTASRRAFIQTLAAGGGALALGIAFPSRAAEPEAKPFQPNAWLRVDPDGTVLVRVGKSEMGQGVRTSLPMIVAEELDVPLGSVRIEQASPGPDFKRLGTGGSGSISGLWDPLRQAGAAAREMLVAAAAARWTVPADTLTTRDGFVLHAATQRKLSYGELAAGAAQQPVPQSPKLKERTAFRLVGKPAKRIDGRDLVTGRARYGVDVRVPGMLFAVVARAPQLGSKVVSFDAAAALKTGGVRNVVQIPTGVAVIAENTWAALRGREALQIEWSESPHAAFDSREHLRVLERAANAPALTIRKDGEGRAAFANVARTIEATYRYPFVAHAALEPVNCTALVTADAATIWSATQTPNGVQGAAAQLLGFPETAITVHVLLIGGGFGRRLGVDFDREAIEIAKLMKGTPVQLLWSREDDMRHGYFQAASVHRLIAGLDQNDRVVAWEHRKASSPHNARRVVADADKVNPEVVGGWAWGVNDMPYHFPAAEMSYAVIDSPLPIGPWRSVFSPSSVFARECFLDELAQQTGKDPLQLRLSLLGATDPNVPAVVEAADNQIDRRRMRKVLETVAAKAGPASTRAGVARGLACNVFHGETYIAYVVDVSLRPNAPQGKLPFRVERVVCALDCGVAVNPLGVAQQVESGVIWSLSNMKNEITVREGRVEQAYYSDFPVVMLDETPLVIETHIVPSDDDRPHGLGEPTVCPLAPAVANALSRLIGRRVRALPVRSTDLAPQPTESAG